MPTPDVDAADLETQAGLFRVFADGMKRLPLYHRLCQAAADDPHVVARVFLARPDQRRINILLAAVHDVLLAGADDPLAQWYGSVTHDPRPVHGGIDDPWPHFRRLVLEDDGVAERIATRSTQTNEVGRCAATMPAIAQIATEAPGAPIDGHRPVGLVEVGASAGLNLLLDRYEYEYDPGGTVGGPSAVTLACQVRGPVVPPVPERLPPIETRVGLDLHPVDVGDRDQARWLVACQWPDQLDRLHRVRAAVALARSDPPRLVQGDAVDDLAPLVEAVPTHALPVIVTTWVMAYLTEDRQAAFLIELDRLGAERDLTYLFAEHPSEVPGLPVPPRPDGAADDVRFSTMVRIDWRDGARQPARRLADMHPHVTWLIWQDQPTR